MFFFIFFDISSLLLRYITPAIPRSSRLDLSKNILKNIDSYLNFRTLGQTLDGFHDLLYGGIGVLEPRERFRLVWLHTTKSREDLGFDATLEYYQNKLKQPQTFNVQWVEDKIANLENGSGPTYFEILVEIIESHENVYFSPYD